VRVEGLLIFLLLVECDTEIAHCSGVDGLNLKRGARLFSRQIGPAGEPAHLAEIGMVKRDLAVDRDGAADVIYRLCELSRLVCDEAESVLRFGRIRFRRDNFAAQILGFAEPPGAAMALGMH